MIIDAHQHFWNFDPERDDWFDESMEMIRKDFFPTNLKPVYREMGVDGCISIQTDPSENENQFLLQLADEYRFIKAVVDWVDMWSSSVDERLNYFSGKKDCWFSQHPSGKRISLDAL